MILQRCTSSGAALSFVWIRTPEGGLASANWLPADAEVPDASASGQGGDSSAYRGMVRTEPGASVPPVPFDPADFFRDPRHWRPPAHMPPGSTHACAVWAALCAIPVGQTRNYGQIAREIGSSPRAVGQACKANPWPVFIPCHRVVPAAGVDAASAGGYSGQRAGPLAQVKAWLLAHEAGTAIPGC